MKKKVMHNFLSVRKRYSGVLWLYVIGFVIALNAEYIMLIRYFEWSEKDWKNDKVASELRLEH